MADPPPGRMLIESLYVRGTEASTASSSGPNTFPSPPRDVSLTDFPDNQEGTIAFEAFDRTLRFLEKGFDPSSQNRERSSRFLWMLLCTHLFRALKNGIRTTHGTLPLPTAFNDLDSDEKVILSSLEESSSAFQEFFNTYQVDPNTWDICLRCLDECNVPITEAEWNSVLMSCDRDIRRTHDKIIKDAVSSLSEETSTWIADQKQMIQDTLIANITENSADAVHLPHFDLTDPRLHNWVVATSYSLREEARNLLMNDAAKAVFTPWAFDSLATTKGKIIADAANASDTFTHHLKVKREQEATEEAHVFYTQTVANLKAEAHTRAKLEADTLLASLKQAAKIESDRELDRYKQQLEAERTSEKDKLRLDPPKDIAPKPSIRTSRAERKAGLASRRPSRSVSRHSVIDDDAIPPSSRSCTPPGAQSTMAVDMPERPSETTPKASKFESPQSSHPISSSLEQAFQLAPLPLAPPTAPPPAPLLPALPTNPPSELSLILASLKDIPTTINVTIADALKPVHASIDSLSKRITSVKNGAWTGWNSPNPQEGDDEVPHDDEYGMDDTDDFYVSKDVGKEETFEAPLFIQSLYRSTHQIPADQLVLTPQQETEVRDAHDIWGLFCSEYHWDPEQGPESERTYNEFVTYYKGLLASRRKPAATVPPPPVSTLNDSIHAPQTHKSRHQNALDLDTPPPPDETANPNPRWTTVPLSNTNLKKSFAAAASAPKASNPLPPSVVTVTTGSGISQDTLNTMTKAQVINAFNLRFGARVSGRHQTKEGVIEAYLAKAATSTSAPTKPAAPPKPKAIQQTEFTVIRNPLVRGLARPRADAPHVVRHLQTCLRQKFPKGTPPPVELIGGRWSSQTSPNFVLTFSGQPSNADVIRVREVFIGYFGPGSTLAPQRGFAKIMLNRVPIVRNEDGSLPSSSQLQEELGYNVSAANLTLLSTVDWWRPSEIKDDAHHGSIMLAFLDEDGSRMSTFLKSAPWMYGERTRPKKFVSLPLIRQCQCCWSLGHDATRCPRPKDLVLCFICGGQHKSDDHQFKCPRTSKHGELKCTCPPSCINCRRARLPAAGHLAIDVSCPLQKKYRTPTTRTGDSTDEEARALSPLAKDIDPTPPP